MDLLNALSPWERSLISDYLCYYGDGGRPYDLDHFLRFWEGAKQDLFRAFGEKLILKKEFAFEKDADELANEMNEKIFYENSEARCFVDMFRDYVKRNFECNTTEYYALRSMVWDTDRLVENIWNGVSFVVPANRTVNKREIQVTQGCKLVKMIGKLAKAFGLDETLFEQFRQCHSQVLNQKKTKGRLCLSIHPMDYITMSDNACGWTSCMCWIDEPGDYRLGTIEMMNSPYCVIAYLEDDKKLCTDAGDWNNKRWRQLYYITHDMILGNKQYPYYSDSLQGQAIRWLRDLMNVMPGYGPYDQTATQIRNNKENVIDGDKKVYFRITMNYMYNDIYDERMAFLASQKLYDGETYNANFSGEAVCTECGAVIFPDDIDAHMTVCRSCNRDWQCSECGDWHGEYDSCYEVDGRSVCHYCYSEAEACEVCGEKTFNYEYTPILIQTENQEIANRFNHSFKIMVCPHCIHYKEYEELFGPLCQVPPQSLRFFDLVNISDKGLETGCLSDENIEFLKALRDAKSDKERLKVLDEYSY